MAANYFAMCKLSVSVINNLNLRWLNEQVQRLLRDNTRPVLHLYDFQV